VLILRQPPSAVTTTLVYCGGLLMLALEATKMTVWVAPIPAQAIAITASGTQACHRCQRDHPLVRPVVSKTLANW